MKKNNKMVSLIILVTLSVLFSGCMFLATITVKAVHIVDENGDFITDKKILDALGEHPNIGYHLESLYNMDRNDIQADHPYNLMVTSFVINVSEDYFQGKIYTTDASTYKYYGISCEYIETSAILQITVIEITEEEYDNYPS